jgi:hypothetical protein
VCPAPHFQGAVYPCPYSGQQAIQVEVVAHAAPLRYSLSPVDHLTPPEETLQYP